MIDCEIFYGIQLNDPLIAELSLVNPVVKSLFIQSGQEYLNQISYKNSHYLGKNIGKICDLSSLALFEANIYSLLDKLVPGYPVRQQSLILFPIAKKHG